MIEIHGNAARGRVELVDDASQIVKTACDFSFRGWPPELWDPPYRGSLRSSGELNRDDEVEIVQYRWGECAPGRLDRVLEMLASAQAAAGQTLDELSELSKLMQRPRTELSHAPTHRHL